MNLPSPVPRQRPPTDPTELPEDAQSILDSIRRIVRALRVSSRAAERDLGLSGAQLFVLQKLGGGETLSLNELARRTLTHQSSVSVVVNRLVERGLVARSRSARDGRMIELTIRAQGRLLLKKAPEAVQERLIASIRELPPAARKRLSGSLQEVVVRAGLAGETPSLFFEERNEGGK